LQAFMALLPILQYPDPRLKKIAATVDCVDEDVRRLVRDMAETMYAAPGIGLAASQVDVHKRIIIVDVSDTHDELKVFINPEIVATSGDSDIEEGCLSVPGVFDKIRRAASIKVAALDVHGASFEMEAAGVLAVCIQHEMDHLVGKVFVDYLSRLKQQRIVAKMKKQRQRAM
jgi:peptide deformylase